MAVYLDSTQNLEQNKNTYPYLCLVFAPLFAGLRPIRAIRRVYFMHFDQPQIVIRLTDPISGPAGPHGKGFFMTFDLERYRAYVAPLGFTREQEDELLRDLWAITETLVDQSLTSSTYPQQLAIACNAFDAFEQAVAVNLDNQPQTEGQKP